MTEVAYTLDGWTIDGVIVTRETAAKFIRQHGRQKYREYQLNVPEPRRDHD